ncbi:MAG: hypothetical protein A2849_01720 [Candidatus Taylorbacteria bacterium RIFCSPHIGHO2_01_FULL_51_15]|uniref:Uncharacterized protein n=1 Tax=Candidatus Taylorbacteria bacterium RIFCSPHIGHO2_01_FULL_51_15 TaxID=1802304 RepID=A0A1G2MAT8_9BACT|nr:MAG: hypothetical protein A2849_01720 [Candidatus Taylorbacteria bacterium RIFCSPHIGHO2_01_FULL_51_15]
MTTTTYNFEEKNARENPASLVSGMILGVMFAAALFFIYSFFSLFFFDYDVREVLVRRNAIVNVQEVSEPASISIFSGESEEYPALKAAPGIQ